MILHPHNRHINTHTHSPNKNILKNPPASSTYRGLPGRELPNPVRSHYEKEGLSSSPHETPGWGRG